MAAFFYRHYPKMIVAALLALAAAGLLRFVIPPANAGHLARGASAATLHCTLDDNEIQAQLSDQDLALLKDILRHATHTYETACPFGEELYIQISPGQHTLALAMDGCGIIRHTQSNRYYTLPKEQHAALQQLLLRYGVNVGF